MIRPSSRTVVPGVGPHVWLQLVRRTTSPVGAGSSVPVGAGVAGTVGTGVGRRGDALGGGTLGDAFGRAGVHAAASTTEIRNGAIRATRTPRFRRPIAQEAWHGTS